ncbi:MAG: hypothetical protein HC915_13000 [Anaerolineae bacterium]|nr:hypothetical protein [Anaerolineae bacterium]
MATPYDVMTLLATVRELRGQMAAALQDQLTERRARLQNEARTLRLLTPQRQIERLRQKLDDQTARMAGALRNTARQERQRLVGLNARLQAASPQNLLARGYAIVERDADGLRMNSAQQAAPGTTLRVTLHDGTLKATVKERALRPDA